jgi:hypothetical protein
MKQSGIREKISTARFLDFASLHPGCFCSVTDYLRKQRQTSITDAYRRGYGKQPAEGDLGGWIDEGVWPDE